MAKRKSVILEPKEVNLSLAQDKHYLVVDRFSSWCNDCKHQATREDVHCRFCGVRFTHITTQCPLEWMPETIKAIRKDLLFVPWKNI